MMMTNEQTIIEAELKISKYKKDYDLCLYNIIVNHKDDNSKPTASELLLCQQKAIYFFNYVEQFVGQSGLLGAHKNGLWVTGFAETCYSVLEIVIQHYIIFEKYKNVSKYKLQMPCKNSYANMQRMIKEYLPEEQWSSMKNTFEKYNLPVSGFIYKKSPDMKDKPIWEKIVLIILSVIFLVSIAILAFFIPNPSEFQIFIFRGIFALGCSIIAALIPGFLSVESRFNNFMIKATGAICIFIIVWLVNPPQIIFSHKF